LPGATGDQSSYRGRFDYAHDRYGLQLDHLRVGDDFNPEVGFTRRTNFRRTTAAVRFSPRPRASRLVRKLNWNANYDYITDGRATRIENRQAAANFQIEFHSGDTFSTDYSHDFEYLPQDFEISPDIVLPVGNYEYDTFRLTYNLGQQRSVSGRANVAVGSFYNGTKREANFSSGRITLSSRVNIEPGVTLHWIDLPQGNFQTRLITARVIYTGSPRSLISSLMQYNASDHTLSSSVRLRWEYRPGSDLFVVYSEGRNTTVGGVPELVNRSLAVKITRLVRF